MDSSRSRIHAWRSVWPTLTGGDSKGSSGGIAGEERENEKTSPKGARYNGYYNGTVVPHDVLPIRVTMLTTLC